MKKIYLEDLSPEKITTKIKCGEIVYNDDIDGVYYKMINGIICRFDNDKVTHYGFEVPNNDGYYFLEKEPLKFEVGKHYKTRKGTEAVCYAYDKESFNPYKFVELNTEIFIRTYEDGKIYNAVEKDLDIVDYWKD